MSSVRRRAEVVQMTTNKVKVIDRGWNDLQKKATALKKGRAASVGIQGAEAQIAEDVHGGMTNVELGAIHEFGTQDGHIPERSHIRSTFDKNKAKYESEMKEISREFYARKDVSGKLLLLGEEVKTDIIETIRSGELEPLAESTLARREGNATPLWNTGQYVNALTATVTNDPDSKRKE